METTVRETNSTRNVVMGILNQVVRLVLLFAVKTVFLRTIGIEYMGINGVFVNMFLILSIVEYGIGTVYLYMLYNPFAESNEIKIAAIYRFFRKIYVFITAGMFLIGLLLIPIVPHIIDIDVDTKSLILYYLIYLFTTATTNLFLYNAHLIIADQKEYITSLYFMITDGVSYVIQIILLILTKDFVLFLIIAFIKCIVFNFLTARRAKKLYPYLKNLGDEAKLEPEEKRTIFNKIKDSFLYRSGFTLLTSADNIIISILVGTIWVGYYSNYRLIIISIMGLVGVFYSAVSASVGNLLAVEDEHSHNSVFRVVQIVDAWITAFATTCLIILTQHFITLWIGSEYLLDFKVLLMIVINFYLMCYRHSVEIFLRAYGIFNRIRSVMIIAAVLNIIASVILGKFYGVFGVLLATNIVVLATFYWFEVKLLYGEIFKKSVKAYFIRNLKNMVFVLFCIGATYFSTSMLNNQSITHFLLKVLACIVIPNALFFITYFKNPSARELAEILSRNYKQLLGRKTNG